MVRGDRIKVWRGFYHHHGIDLGDGTVVHFTGEPGRKNAACIERTTFDEFAQGGAPQVVEPAGAGFSPDDVAARALSRVGEFEYNLVTNNCEHFASWCQTGSATSVQVRTTATALVGAALVFLGFRAGRTLTSDLMGEKGPLVNLR